MQKIRSELELEQAINNSRFFTVSGEEMEAARSTAKAKLVLDLCDYSKHYWWKYSQHEGWKTDHGDEIYDRILYCMEHYNPEKGQFTNYFKNQVKFAILNSDKEVWKVNKYEGIDPISKNNKGSESSLFEAEQFAQDNVDEMIEKQGALCQMTAYFEIIEEAFRKKQERTWPRLRTLWTLKCFDALISIDIPDKHYTWIDYKFLEKYRDTENLPAQKEVAALLGRSEEDASRDIRQFCERVAPQFRALQNKS